MMRSARSPVVSTSSTVATARLTGTSSNAARNAVSQARRAARRRRRPRAAPTRAPSPRSRLTRAALRPSSSHAPSRAARSVRLSRRSTASRTRKWSRMKRANARPISFLRAGTIAVCGIGRPSGRRNSAVTANQSASPPTSAASANARSASTYGVGAHEPSGDDIHDAHRRPAARWRMRACGASGVRAWDPALAVRPAPAFIQRRRRSRLESPPRRDTDRPRRESACRRRCGRRRSETPASA